MVIIVSQSDSDGFTYFCDRHTPCEYESLEAAIVDFEKAIEEANGVMPIFFGGSAFFCSSINEVTLCSIEEWLKEHQEEAWRLEQDIKNTFVLKIEGHKNTRFSHGYSFKEQKKRVFSVFEDLKKDSDVKKIWIEDYKGNIVR